jgi:hypothetical protein
VKLFQCVHTKPVYVDACSYGCHDWQETYTPPSESAKVWLALVEGVANLRPVPALDRMTEMVMDQLDQDGSAYA